MRKRVLIVMAVIFVLIAAAGWFWWRSPSAAVTKKSVASRVMPEVSVASLNITDISEDRISLNSKIKIKNPLPVDLHADGLKYEIYIDSIKVLQDAYRKPLSIRSNDSSVIELPLELLAAPMARVLTYFDRQKADSADYTVKTNFTVDMPVAGNRNIDLKFSKRLPAVRLLKIKVKDLDLNMLKLKKEGVNMVMQVTNPNVFPVKMKDGAFTFSIEDDMEMKGKLEKIVNIPARGSQNVSMHADLKEGKVFKVGLKMLTSKNKTPYHFKFTGRLVSDNKLLNNSAIATTMKGTLNDLLQAAKDIKEGSEQANSK